MLNQRQCDSSGRLQASLLVLRRFGNPIIYKDFAQFKLCFVSEQIGGPVLPSCRPNEAETASRSVPPVEAPIRGIPERAEVEAQSGDQPLVTLDDGLYDLRNLFPRHDLSSRAGAEAPARPVVGDGLGPLCHYPQTLCDYFRQPVRVWSLETTTSPVLRRIV